MGRIIVDDGVDHFSHRDLLLDRIEEADELLVAMVLHVAADDGAIEDVESCEQRGGAVTFVVVRSMEANRLPESAPAFAPEIPSGQAPATVIRPTATRQTAGAQTQSPAHL